MFCFGTASVAALIAFASLHTDLANGLLDRLETDYPRQMCEFFPRSMSPNPDAEFAATFGDAVLRDVQDAAAAVFAAMAARVEIETRKYPN